MTGDMESVYERELQGRSPSKLKTLSLTGCKSKDCSGFPSSDLINLETLNLDNVGITSLKGLPKLPKLSTLNLANNQLDGGDFESLVESCPKLEKLVLNGNPIKDISKLQPLAKLENLRNVDLADSEAAKEKDFETKLRDMIPQLKKQKNGKGAEGEDDDEVAEDDDSEEDEDSDDEDDEDEGGLAALTTKEYADEDDDEDFEGEGDDDEEDEDDDDEDDVEDNEGGAGEPVSPPAKAKRGVKRPAEDENDG